MRNISLLAALLLLPFGGVPAALAEAGQAKPDYRVQPGDTLQVWLWNETEEGKEVVVDSMGSISLPPAGELQVKGLTIEQIAARITTALRAQHIKNPRVDVVLKARRPESVFVLGAVARPGAYVLAAGMRVRDAIGIAGGLAPGADGAHATLSSTEKGVTPIDLEKLLSGADLSQDLPLGAGDVVNVPALVRKSLAVLVVGQVNRPGSLELMPGSRLSDAMAASGGPTPVAALKKATLSRAGITMPIDLEAVLRQGELAGNVALQDGDVILVPEGRNEVTLLGEFMRPGTYPFREGDTLVTAMVLGGGPGPLADLQRAVLKRGEQETPINLKAMLRDGDLKQDTALKDGDLLVIPPGVRVYAYGAFIRPGLVVIAHDGKLVEVLMQAGGTAPNARLDKAEVVRVVDGEAQRTKLNVKMAVEKGGPGHDFQFKDGDVLVVPAKGVHMNWAQILSTATNLILFGTNILR